MNTITASIGLMAAGTAMTTAGATVLRSIDLDRVDTDPQSGKAIGGTIAMGAGATLAVAGGIGISTMVKSGSGLAYVGTLAGITAAGLGSLALGWQLGDAFA